jgi:hypothetical protein
MHKPNMLCAPDLGFVLLVTGMQEYTLPLVLKNLVTTDRGWLKDKVMLVKISDIFQKYSTRKSWH